MEENNKGGFTAEGRKLRPRRPRVSDNGYTSDYSNSNRGERKSYGEHKSYGSYERKSYGNSERRSFGHSDRSNYGGSERGGFGERKQYGEHRNNFGERRSFHSEGQTVERSFNSEDRGERRFSSEGRSFSSYRGERSGFRSEGGKRSGGRSFDNRGGERRFSSEGRSFNSEGRRFSSEGRSINSEDRGERRFSYEGRSFSGNRGERSGFRSEGGKRFGGRSFDNRNRFGNRSQGGFNKKRHSYGFDDENAGINNMINRKPQVSDAQFSDNDFAAPAFKEEVRLNKYIANSGVCSRREADQMIQAGVVTVNGEVVTELGTKVNVLKDVIKFNGETLKGEDKVYIVMNKPKGYVTTASDPHADRTVMDLLKGCDYRVFPVGRLDKNTTGVLMFTNDGEIAEKLTHPSYDKKKIYQVILDHPVSQEDFDAILEGLTLGDGEIKADELEYIDAEDHRKVGIEIHSGKNRIVRRIFESLGYNVKDLDRVYFAGLTKKGLKKGEWRYLSTGEANVLKMGAYV